MKKVLFLIIGILILIGGIAACGDGSMPVSAHPGVIRLHILANSDSDADQSLKLNIRDYVLKNWSKTLSSTGTTADAWKELNGLLPDIKKGIAEELKRLGAEYSVKLETGTFDFPEKDYNGAEFPAGKYKALRIELGSAAGHNWWCVMFPPLCLVGENGEMDMQAYMDLVKKLDAGDIAPQAPVRSWLFDKLFGSRQWDRDFMAWAKEFLSGSDGR